MIFTGLTEPKSLPPSQMSWMRVGAVKSIAFADAIVIFVVPCVLMLGQLSRDWLLKLFAPLLLMPVVKLGLVPEKLAELVTFRFGIFPVVKLPVVPL